MNSQEKKRIKDYKLLAKANVSKQNADLMLVGFGSLIVTSLVGLVTISLGSFFVAGAVDYGIYKVFYGNYEGRKIAPKEALSGFSEKYGESFLAGFVTHLLKFVPKYIRLLNEVATLLIILKMLNISGFGQTSKYVELSQALTVVAMLVSVLVYVLRLQFGMTQYILMREPEAKAMHSLRKSRVIMSGHVLKYFLLRLSFIGWAIVSLVSFGLANIYTRAYFYATETAFFTDIYEAFDHDEFGQEILDSLEDDEEDNTIGGIYIG